MAKNSAQKKKQPKAIHSVDSMQPQTAAETEVPEPSYINLSRGERIASGLLGGGLLTYGLTHFITIRGQASNVAGAFLLTRAISGHCPLYTALGVDSSPQGRMHHLGITDPHPLQFRQSIITHRSPAEVFEFSRDQEQMARCFPQVKQLQKIDGRRSTWVFHDRTGHEQFPVPVEITQETEPTTIAWTAFPDSKLRVTGSLQFKHGPHNQGTEIVATVHIVPPAGLMGATFLRWLSPVSNLAVTEILHKMKQILETGEVSRNEEMPPEAADPTRSWPKRMKTRLQMRTIQSLASRRMT